LRAGPGAWAGQRGPKPFNFPKPQALGAPGVGGSATGLRARARGDVYCVLRCEGHVRRTALAPGRPAPAWHEDVAFKAVSVGSDLQARVRRATPIRVRPLFNHTRPAGTAGHGGGLDGVCIVVCPLYSLAELQFLATAYGAS